MALNSDAEGELLRKVVQAKGGNQPILDAVNHFYKHKIPQILGAYNISTIDGLIGTFNNSFIVRPTINDLKGGGKSRRLWPYEARRNLLSYMAQLFVKFQLNQNIDGKLVPIPDQNVDVYLGKIPAIVQSQVCHLFGMTQEERYAEGEAEKDPGCYAIIRGVEKVLINIENLRTSEAYLYEDKEEFTVRYTSQSFVDTTVNIIKEDHDDIHVTFSKMGISNNSINVFYIFNVLGITNNTIEKVFEVMEYFIIDDDINIQTRRRKEMRFYMQTTANTFLKQTSGVQEQIYTILAGKIHDKNIINSPNRNVLIRELIWKELFKNVPINYIDLNENSENYKELITTLNTKIRMLASMVTKYVDFKNGYRKPDDRDAWGNKQLVDAGKHLTKAFARIWKLMIASIQNKVTSNRLTTVSQIKNAINQNYMTEQFINSYNKELFTMGKGQRETAIVDTLKRDNLLSAMSHIRRISTPTNRRAKIRDKRLIHNTQWGAVCPVMTPEGEACLEEGTKIMLSNGKEIKIKDMVNGDEIITIDPITLKQSPSKITRHFIKSSKEYGRPILKIVTINGRNVVCTDDHPFLTQYGWISARDLNTQIHLLAIYPGIQPITHKVKNRRIILNSGILQKELRKLYVKPSLIEKYTQDLQEKGLIPLYDDDQRLPILARITGYLLANGSLQLNENIPYGLLYFDGKYDGEMFLQDMAYIGFNKNTLKSHLSTIFDKETGTKIMQHIWTSNLQKSFAALLLALDINGGKKVNNPSKPIPKWVVTGTLAVKREFVAGFQGGNNSEITWTKCYNKFGLYKFNFARSIQYKNPEFAGNLVIFMQQIADICKELGVEVLSVKHKIKNVNCHIVQINFSNKGKNILKYMENIGYRYACAKSTKGYHISEYLSYKYNKIKEHVGLTTKIHKPTPQKIYSSQIASEQDIQSKQLPSFLEYKANSGISTHRNIIDFGEWIGKTKIENNCIFMPIGKITPNPHCIVADFTTNSENHSMISNGFITHNCGLVKDTAITAYVSLDRDENVVRARLNGMKLMPMATIVNTAEGKAIKTAQNEYLPILNDNVVETSEGVVIQSEPFYSPTPIHKRRNPLYLNGVNLGFCDSSFLREHLLQLRRTQQLYFDTGIVLDRYKELKIFTNEGRICRPLLIVDKETQELIIDLNKLRGENLDTLMSEGALEYIDIAEQEQEQLLIAEDPKHLQVRREELMIAQKQLQQLETEPTPRHQLDDSVRAVQRLRERMKYTHCEIDPTAIMGISSISMPFAEFNPGPRDTYQASMVRQALGGNSARIELRFDTTIKTILEPGVPTISTDAHEYLGLDQYPSGRELVIAITTYGGSNQEDALTFNKTAIDLGLFMMMIYHSYKTTICQSTKHQERIGVPDYPKNQANRYSKLDLGTGIVRVGEFVESGDCLVGKVIVASDGKVKNDSLYVEVGKEGIVDEVYVTDNAESCKLIRIRLRELRKIQAGDKLASRYSQKGTIGAILPEKEMPWIVSDNPHLNGVKPHVIFNPHGIPSRMTMGKLYEILVGKATAITAERFNATAFRRFGQPNKPDEPTHDNIYTFKDQLEQMGFSRSGKEKMINGITGREMDVEIFVGTAYYQLLRHLVKDKMQARGTGTVQFLTRQPTSGIRKQGGLRFGEMERDALLDYGSSYILQERMNISSDAYQAIVCKECGMFAATNIGLGIPICRKCHTGTFTRVTIPYAFKLLNHYLAAANMRVKLRIKEI